MSSPGGTHKGTQEEGGWRSALRHCLPIGNVSPCHLCVSRLVFRVSPWFSSSPLHKLDWTGTKFFNWTGQANPTKTGAAATHVNTKLIHESRCFARSTCSHGIKSKTCQTKSLVPKMLQCPSPLWNASQGFTGHAKKGQPAPKKNLLIEWCPRFSQNSKPYPIFRVKCQMTGSQCRMPNTLSVYVVPKSGKEWGSLLRLPTNDMETNGPHIAPP